MNNPLGQWHLDKRVPVGIILALLVQAGGVVWFFAEMKKDIELLKAAQAQQHERDARQDKAHDDGISLLRSDIQELGRKLDRLIERGR